MENEEMNKEVEEKIETTEELENNNVEVKTEYDELNDRYKRLFAEFENYKKRSHVSHDF